MKTYNIIKVNVIEGLGFEEDQHLEYEDESGFCDINDANRECAKLNYYASDNTYYYYVKENEENNHCDHYDRENNHCIDCGHIKSGEK